MDRKMVNFIKEQYPPGTRIRLNSMEDPYAPIAPGTEGVVLYAHSAQFASLFHVIFRQKKQKPCITQVIHGFCLIWCER